ncbi:MAG: decaprenylphospho-beta-D-erythro-pentofuranosid-2-ulose 2-reductase [Propionibacteriaceae bacterium]|jgi:decaprenylphospho-beta-D-erythro-pentofuranosid-2-ulose 2-reductase|nr:decaprenylphospho-beta-D-erythro-pentofuranosid-2-ulose 2-reductase [Propionibacteriaceae bacterium]
MSRPTGDPGVIALFGATSGIGLAIVAEYLARTPARVILVGRDQPSRAEAAQDLSRRGAREVTTVDFDALDFDAHPAVLERVFADGEVDLAIIAFGQLGDVDRLWRDQPRLVDFIGVNLTGAASVGALLVDRLLPQGHGQLIVLASVAGEVVRPSNFVYGSTKAGLDAFFKHLGTVLKPTGLTITVARPGRVKTKMIAPLAPAPLTITPARAAADIVAAARAGRPVVWTPGAFRWIMLVLKHLPWSIQRRLPF